MAAQQNAAAQQILRGALENSETVHPNDDPDEVNAKMWVQLSGGFKNVYLLFSEMYKNYNECIELNKLYKRWLIENNINLETGISNIQGGKRKSKTKRKRRKSRKRRKKRTKKRRRKTRR